MKCPECDKPVKKRELSFPHELRCYYIYYCPSCDIDIVVKPHEDGLKEAIKDLSQDISSKPKALRSSKGGETEMSESKEKKEEEMPKSMIDNAMRILKKDYNWKFFGGLVVGWLLKTWLW